MADNQQRARSWGLQVISDDYWSSLYYKSLADLHSIVASERETIALEGLRARFEALRPEIRMLDKLADEQGIDHIDDINDAAKLLFQHSVYKSYPVSFVEKGQFDRLTKWLDGLTTADLSHLDCTGIDTIDDWIDLLEAQSSIRIVHSSGTSGKLSFLPRGAAETDLTVQNWRLIHEDAFEAIGEDAPDIEDLPVIMPDYRTGSMGLQRVARRVMETVFGGDESMLICLNEGRLSADALALGGRLQIGQQRGELGEIRISPGLRAKRDELIQSMVNAPSRLANFVAHIADRFKGRPVGMMVMDAKLYDIAVIARNQGIKRLFSPHSNILYGGGWKGRTPPEDWREVISEFLGIEDGDIRTSYGMSECIAGLRACRQGHYHLFPFQIPFLLDSVTGDPYPREGTHTGRFGVFDLGATTYWGGFLTGDKVTLSYQPCACGRTTPAVQKDSMRRYTQEEGGDDKISCAGAPEAHDNALAYLLASAEE